MAQPTSGANQTAEPEPSCQCTRDSALAFITALCVVAAALLILGAIETTFVTVSFQPSDWILAIYIIALSFIGALAELRYFRVLRSIVFPILKYVYILTNYTVRGCFWFFLGSISWNGWTQIFPMLATCSACAAGVLLIILNAYWKFPVFVDPQMEKMQTEARLRWERDDAQRRLEAARNAPGGAPGTAAVPNPAPSQVGTSRTYAAASEPRPI